MKKSYDYRLTSANHTQSLRNYSGVESNKKECKEMSLRQMRISLENIKQIDSEKSRVLKLDLDLCLPDLIVNNKFASSCVTIGLTHYHCHKMLLNCYSDHFQDYLEIETDITLDENQIDANSFEIIYNWMKNDKPLIEKSNLLQALNAARFLRIKAIQDQCWRSIEDAKRFSEENACKLYLDSKKLGVDCVKCVLIQRIKKFFLMLVASKEFLELDYQELRFLLSLSSIAVNNEIEVFMSAIRWIKFDWENRKTYIEKVMSSIRFALLPKWFLVYLQTKTECTYLDQITQTEPVKFMIHNSITVLAATIQYKDQPYLQAKFLARYNLSLPKRRQWIIDSQCLYHHSDSCKNLQFISYNDFCTYLGKLQKSGVDYWKNFRDDIASRNGHCLNSLCVAASKEFKDVPQVFGGKPSPN